MAKKNIVKIVDTWNIKASPLSDNKFEMEISGTNSKGTMVQVTMTVPDYYMSHLVTHFSIIIQKRVDDAEKLKSGFIRNINSGFVKLTS